MMPANEIHNLVGNGDAKVSVSMGVAEKDFGNGFDVHVSVTLTCEQDDDIIGFAYEAASDIASKMIIDSKTRAQELWEAEQED